MQTTNLLEPKILVTGATGFLGKEICHRLTKLGISFYAASRSPAKLGVWLPTDLTKPFHIPTSVTNVIHSAALLNPLAQKTYDFNVAALENIVASLEDRHLTFVSSLIIFPGTQAPSLCPELPINLLSLGSKKPDFYTSSKIQCERLLSNLPNIAIVRPGLLVGSPFSNYPIAQHDALLRVLASLQDYPQRMTLNPALRVDTTPVEFVAKVLVKASLTAYQGVMHAAHPTGLYLKDMLIDNLRLPQFTKNALDDQRLNLCQHSLNPLHSKYYPLHLFLSTNYLFVCENMKKIEQQPMVCAKTLLNHYVTTARSCFG
jgi:nucleoside-diphosphate-sugar epimerase